MHILFKYQRNFHSCHFGGEKKTSTKNLHSVLRSLVYIETLLLDYGLNAMLYNSFIKIIKLKILRKHICISFSIKVFFKFFPASGWSETFPSQLSIDEEHLLRGTSRRMLFNQVKLLSGHIVERTNIIKSYMRLSYQNFALYIRLFTL